MSEALILDVRVNSYQGLPTRLVATLKVDTGLIYISDEKPYHPPVKEYSILELLKIKKRAARTMIITDAADVFEKWDLLFNEVDHMNEVVRAYQMKSASNLLKISPAVMGKYNPENVLQQRKIDVKNGAVWDMSTELQNGHMCILLACWGALRATANYSFAHQIQASLEPQVYGADSEDLDEPFTI